MKTARFLPPLAGLVITVFLFGCATPSSLDGKFYFTINSFHNLTPNTMGHSFIVGGDTNLIGSLENQLYLRIVDQELQSRQHRSVEVTDTPDWIVIVDYENLPGRSYSTTRSVYGTTGGGLEQHQGTVYGSGGTASYQGTTYKYPSFGVVGQANEEVTLIAWRVRLQIYDGAAFRQKRVKQLFDARMVAVGSGGTLSQAFPLLIHELFNDFPGTSGAKREKYVSF